MSTESALTTTLAPTRRTISPYDFTSGDNPGTLISKPLLRGPNLHLALKARKKFGFADGSIPQPAETSPEFEDWIANNALVVSWIKLTIDESLYSLSHTDDSHELWTQIQKRFGVKNGQRVQRVKTKLATCRQKGLTIEAYYGKLTQLWRSLADYQRAKMVDEIQKELEEDKLHQFLMGLEETTYGPVKSALLNRVPLPTLEEAYNALTQDEKSKLLERLHDESSDKVSIAVQATSRLRPNDNKSCSNFMCTRLLVVENLDISLNIVTKRLAILLGGERNPLGTTQEMLVVVHPQLQLKPITFMQQTQPQLMISTLRFHK